MTDPGEAVEALARDLGWWLGPRGPGLWTLAKQRRAGSAVSVLRRWSSELDIDEEHRLPDPEALLLLHLARIGPTRERCPACEGGRQSMSRGDMMAAITKGEYASVGACARAGWNFDTSVSIGSGSWPGLSRPCPTCAEGPVECSTCAGTGKRSDWSGCGTMDEPHRVDCQYCVRKGKVPALPTGWVTREHGWAERWLRARPQPIDPDTRRLMFGDNPGPTAVLGGCGDVVSTTHAPGDAEARADLWVLADQLQDKTDPLGDVLALWLSGAPCDECDGHGAPLAATLYKYFEHAIAERWELTPDSASRVKADLCKMVRDAGFPDRDIEVTVDLDRRSFQVDGMDDLADWSTCSCKGAGKAYAAQLIEASP